MIPVGQTELRRNRVARIAIAQALARLGISAVGVAALYHEILDAAVEERAVIEAFAGKFEEVLAVQRRVVREGYPNVAHVCLDAYYMPLLLLRLGGNGKHAQGKKSDKDYQTSSSGKNWGGKG